MSITQLQPDHINSALLAEWASQAKQYRLYYVVLGQLPSGDQAPNWEYAATLMFDHTPMSYCVEGHGIGFNQYQVASYSDMVERILADNQRFNSGGMLFAAAV